MLSIDLALSLVMAKSSWSCGSYWDFTIALSNVNKVFSPFFVSPQLESVTANKMIDSKLYFFIVLILNTPIYNVIFRAQRACKNIKRLYICTGKSYTTSSCRLPQDGNIARVRG